MLKPERFILEPEQVVVRSGGIRHRGPVRPHPDSVRRQPEIPEQLRLEWILGL